jgi:hypothetical protein
MINGLPHQDRAWMYNACPSPDCKKKVTEDHTGGWRCEKCNDVYDECNPRYVISMAACDLTGMCFHFCFLSRLACLIVCVCVCRKNVVFIV